MGLNLSTFDIAKGLTACVAIFAVTTIIVSFLLNTLVGGESPNFLAIPITMAFFALLIWGNYNRGMSFNRSFDDYRMMEDMNRSLELGKKL